MYIKFAQWNIHYNYKTEVNLYKTHLILTLELPTDQNDRLYQLFTELCPEVSIGVLLQSCDLFYIHVLVFRGLT